MDTKWKNTNKDNVVSKWKNTDSKITPLIRENRSLVIACVSGFLGLLGLYFALQNIYYMQTTATISVGILINILIGIAVVFGMKFMLAKIYGDWMPKDESFYDDWKLKQRKLQKIIIIACSSLFLIAFIFFYNMPRFLYYLPNYSMGYLLMFTVIIQFIVSEACVIKFMNRKLNLLMECMAEINKKNLEAAIEIEKKSIEAAVKSEKMKVDLISNVSHDLKTPLTSLIGYIELMKKEKLSKVNKDYVDVISNKAEKLADMVENLFSLAKASSGNITVNLEPIRLNTLIEQIYADMSNQIKSSGLDFVTAFTGEDTLIMTDNNHMYRICQNLLENALKYSAPNTRVFIKTFIETKADRENVCMEITNTSGYPMDFNKEDIVERFARGDKARSSDGNGLGLAIVSTYTGALGGSFDVNIDCDQFKATLAFPAAKNS